VPLTLVEAFDLLKRVLRELNALAPTTIDEDTVRERMQEIAGRTDDPIFNRPRFGRLLRQANDASVVDLSKTAQGFLVTLRAEAAPAASAAEPVEAAPEEKHARGHRRGGRGRGRGGEAAAPAHEPAAPEVHVEPVPAPMVPAVAAPSAPSAPASRLRWGRGAKGHAVKGAIPLVGVVEMAEVVEEKKPAGRKPAARRGPARRGGRGKKKGPAPEA
jgi:hypothetical protein